MFRVGGMAGDCRGWPGIVMDGGGLLEKARMMSHDAIMIDLEVYEYKYDFNLG